MIYRVVLAVLMPNQGGDKKVKKEGATFTVDLFQNELADFIVPNQLLETRKIEFDNWVQEQQNSGQRESKITLVTKKGNEQVTILDYNSPSEPTFSGHSLW